MKDGKIFRYALLHAIGAILYIALVASIIANGEQVLGGVQGPLAGTAFLLLFVISAAITGMATFGRPLVWFLDGKKREAIMLAIMTVGFMALAAVLILGGIFAGASAGIFPDGNNGGGVACTMEAKICSDGTAVGRTGPNCEFAACPGEDGDEFPVDIDVGEIVPFDSGVRGTVLLGPQCPVVREGEECPDKPYKTSVSIYRGIDVSTRPFLTIQSDADGAFVADLPPGEYTLFAGGGRPFPACAQSTVTVAPGGFISIVLSCDTGIR